MAGASPPVGGEGRRSRRPDGRRTAWLFRFDREFESRFVAGADEAGRGSLAGPLVAAAVLFDYRCMGPEVRKSLAGLDDSKRKTEDERQRLYPAVLAAAKRVAVTVRCARGIDSRGLHVTNLDGLGQCLSAVAVPGARCLSDGFRLGSRCQVDHEAVVAGDARSAAIAAASVIAKVTRDRYMRRAAETYSGWDFESNVGYSSPGHREAISRIGICALHRRSFASTAYVQLKLS